MKPSKDGVADVKDAVHLLVAWTHLATKRSQSVGDSSKTPRALGGSTWHADDMTCSVLTRLI